MTEKDRELALTYLPHIRKDLREPFPVLYLGYTVFHEKGESPSFERLILDPAEENAAVIIEYAVYYNYDIQHLYDLEHVWVAADSEGRVSGCWSSFHGMRLCAHRVSGFRAEGTHPVLYAQPGKHALLPDPALFWLNPQFPVSCNRKAGGGLLIKQMFAGELETDTKRDGIIRAHILENYAFEPSLEYENEQIREDQVIPWENLRILIPECIRMELKRIGA